MIGVSKHGFCLSLSGWRTTSAVQVMLLVMVMTLTACHEVFDTHPYDVGFQGPYHLNAANAAKMAQLCDGKDTLRFVVTGDTQGWYDETADMVSDINRRGKADFVIHGGDLSNYGATQEFVRQRSILGRLHVPYVALIGNHDCLGTGPDVFGKMYGPANFSFIVDRILFLCLNTNALEYDYSEPIPDFDFMLRESKTDTTLYDRTVICMHAPPYNEQFNNNVVLAFQHYTYLFRGLLFCTAGHVHRNEAKDLYGDGIIYYCSDSANHRNYLLFTITPSGYDYEIVYY